MTVTPASRSRAAERPPKPKPENPLETAIKLWAERLPANLLESINLTLAPLISSAPKRWVAYPPMVLLSSGSFEDPAWDILRSNTTASKHLQHLWVLILTQITKREGKGTLTHLAINQGIPSHQTTNHDNILRTPSGLIMLSGDFGPALSPDHPPSAQDWLETFWVSTKQNGITQIWAPRYTMFSRGNIKEKARLLDFHASDAKIESRRMENWGSPTAIDLYAGIGYFVFSYVTLGMRVAGWELNPWSVEGLRRGAVANGWSVRVVRPGETFEDAGERIVIFLEDNKQALSRRQELGTALLEDVRHVNCGLLPSSEDSWIAALELLSSHSWLHMHENVGVNDTQLRRLEIEGMCNEWLVQKGDERGATVEHVELVKTFAPGVWHCVFDVFLSKA